MKAMGVYALEKMECGCQVKHYTGGTKVTTGCLLHPEKVEYVCGSCGKSMTKRALKKHRWSHAI